MTAPADQRPSPGDDLASPFFAAAAEGRLLVIRCACGDLLLPSQRSAQPLTRCPACGSPELAWVEVSGDATVVTWTIPRGRDGSGQGIAGIVELVEGPWLLARLRVEDGAQLAAGQPVRIVAGEIADGGQVLPTFSPR